ncbi:pyruvate dehydrogenase (acetyl-transferring) E1 component subunit alpha [Burkholderiaceae bacterium FT117]|nr:pyruvate dehydrogenase (acetyl-transferring) E1 component subunit alpha [Zeimonas sediminis]MCM5571276.1 pyruvate dehydrogenase (acetyl-transferring) E1 component subunit alpha [Zeimonas sediminis]
MSIDRDEARLLLRQMIRIRRFEEKCAELYSAGSIRGFLHLYIGEEAIASAAMPELRDDDSVLATYREHGHALARGVPAGAIMAEMFGKQEGCSRGRGGSMHLFDASRRFFGGSAIVGGALPMTVGFALAEKMRGTDRIAACFFGEGAMAEGEFHESMNLAALWKLPALFLCENNLYAMGTALARSESNTDLCAKARSYGLEAVSVDGMDPLAVRDAMRSVVARMRADRLPAFVEFRTYRFRAHSMFDAELYRDKAEVEQWKERGPIVSFTRQMLEHGVLEQADVDAIERAVADEVADAVAFAEAGTWEPIEDLAKDVYARPPGSAPVVARVDAARDEAAPAAPATDEAPPPGQPRSAPKTVRTTYRDALRAGLREALARDPRVFLMGEDVGRYGGSYAVSKGLLEEFGEDRIRDTPLSESGFVGAGIGAALNGMRPIVEVMTVNFSLLAADQIVNNAATLRHMSGGQLNVPVVIRMSTGGGRQLAAQHSHSFEGQYAHVPGLRVIAPATLEDARGMLLAALQEPDPVLVFEHAMLLGMEGELAEDAGAVDIDHAAVRREGRDLSLITYGGSLHKCMAAAEQLAGEGIEAEVLDLRTLRPLDADAIVATVSKTRRAVIVDEGWKTGSLAGEIVALLVERAFYELDAPIARVCTAEVPIPYPKHLEDAALPQVERIVAAAREAVGR